MTVSVKRNKVQYTGDNSTTAFSVTFPYTETSQVKVYLGSTLQTITTHYTLTDPGATGTVNFLTPPGTGVNVSLIRETDYLQGVDYVNNDALDAETLEKAFDKLTMMAQQLDAKIDASVGFDETVAGTTSLKLASDATDLAGKLLAFDDSGNFVTTQEIGTFKGSDTTTTTAAYVVRDLIRDSSNDNVYFTKVNAPSGTLLTNTSYFELLVDVATVRQLKVAAETARTGAETAETNAAASLASFQGQYKSAATNPYGGAEDEGDLWYDTSASILKYYNGTGFEPVTTSLATVTDNYLTISNQVITAGTVPISLGGTGATTASGARAALGLVIGTDVQAQDAGLADIAGLAVTDGNIIVGDGSNWVAESGATARTSLGLGTAATTDADAYANAAQGEKADSALQDVVDDTTPQLGGNLDLVTYSIVSTSARDINITPDTTGNVVLGNFSFDADQTVGLSQDNYVLTYDNSSGQISLEAASVTESQISDFGTYQTADQALTDISGLAATDGNIIVGNGTTWAAESGATARTSLGLSIGTDVQAYSSTNADYSDTTANFTGTLQNGGSNVLVASDIGSSVQAAGSYLTSVDLAADVGSTVLPVANGGTGVTGLSSLNAADLGSNNGVTDATGGYVLTADGTGGVAWEAATGGISDIVSDTTPQLGGNLDVNGNSIVSVSAGNISITPDTTGKIILDGLSWPTADGSADQVLQTDGSGNLSFVDQSGGGGSGSSYIEHSSTVSDSLAISAGTNRMYIGNTSFSSGGVTMAGYLVISHGYANFTGASALNVTGTLNVVG